MESVEVRTSSPVSADVRLMMSHSARTDEGHTADPTGASSEPEAFPAGAVPAEESSPTEKQKKRKKRIRALFRGIGKAMCRVFCCGEDDIVSPFPCSDPTDVQPDISGLQWALSLDPCPSGIELPLNPDTADLELLSVSDVSSLVLSPESDPEPSMELLSVSDMSISQLSPVPSFCNIELTPDVNPADPEPSPVPGPSALDSGIPGPSGSGAAFEKRKKKGIAALFRRMGKALFTLCCNEDDVKCSDPTDVQPDLSGIKWPGPSALESEIPGPSGSGAAFEKQEKKQKGIGAFLRRFQMGNKVAPDLPADEPVAHQDPADQTSESYSGDPVPSPVPDPSSLVPVAKQDLADSQSGSSVSSLELTPVMGLADPEPKPIPDALDVPGLADPEPKPIPDALDVPGLADPEPKPIPDALDVPGLADPEPKPIPDALDVPGLADPEPKPIPDALDVPGPSSSCSDTGSFSSCYEVRGELGSGGFGIVCEGMRRFDGQKVAIKFIPKINCKKFIELPGFFKPLLAEVAVNLLLRRPPKSPYIVQMFDWFEQPEQYVLIMEYPHPCETLRKFAICSGLLDETVARGLMRQAVLAAIHYVDQNIFHKDIKTDNILVNTETLQLKLIDFGCSELFQTSKGRKWVVQSTVWSLGRVLLEIVSGDQPLSVLQSWNLNPLRSGLSNECQELIKQCLDPLNKSLTLEKMLEHAWFVQN